MIEQQTVRQIVENAVKNYILNNLDQFHVIPVGISNRHVHLSKEHLHILFGAGHELEELFKLSQTGQYAAKETVTITGPKGSIDGVRILGPVRGQTQVEILMSDTYKLGIKAPVRDSGNLAGTPGITIKGPCGVINTASGLIVAKRHIHLNPEEARILEVQDKSEVKVGINGERAVIFEKVLVRVDPSFKADFHVDIDEANGAGLKKGDIIKILK